MKFVCVFLFAAACSSPVIDVEVTDDPPTVEHEVAGLFLQELTETSGNNPVFSWSYAAFFEWPSVLRLAFDGSAERCATSWQPIGDTSGRRDVGDALAVQVGGEDFEVGRDLEWSEGEILYMRDVTVPSQWGVGGEVAIEGSSTGLRMPESLEFAGDFVEDYLATGVLDLRWDRGGSDTMVEVELDLSVGDEPRTLYCTLDDDGRARVDTGWRDLADAHGGLFASRTAVGDVAVADLGLIRVTVAHDFGYAVPRNEP